MDNKQERTVVHVEYNGQHYYLAHSLQFIRNSVLKTWVSHWGH